MRFERSETITDLDISRKLYPIGSLEVVYGDIVKAFGKANIRPRVSGNAKDLFTWHIKIDGKPFILLFHADPLSKEYLEVNNLTKDTAWNNSLVEVLILGETPGYKVGTHKTEEHKKWDDNLTKQLKHYIQLKDYGLSKDSEDMFGGMLRSI